MNGIILIVALLAAILIGLWGLSTAYNGYRHYLNSIQATGFLLGMLLGGGAGLLLSGQSEELVVKAVVVFFLALVTGLFGMWLIMKLFVVYVFIQGALLGTLVWLVLTVPAIAGGTTYLLSAGLSHGLGALIELFTGTQILFLLILMFAGGILSLFFNRIIGILSSGLWGGILIWISLALAALGLLAGSGAASGDPLSMLLGTPLLLLLITGVDLLLTISGVVHQFSDHSTELIILRLRGQEPEAPQVQRAPVQPRQIPVQPSSSYQQTSTGNPYWDAARNDGKPQVKK